MKEKRSGQSGKEARSRSTLTQLVLHQLVWNLIPTLVMLLGVGGFFLWTAESLQAQKNSAATQTLVAHVGADMDMK